MPTDKLSKNGLKLFELFRIFYTAKDTTDAENKAKDIIEFIEDTFIITLPDEESKSLFRKQILEAFSGYLYNWENKGGIYQDDLDNITITVGAGI